MGRRTSWRLGVAAGIALAASTAYTASSVAPSAVGRFDAALAFNHADLEPVVNVTRRLVDVSVDRPDLENPVDAFSLNSYQFDPTDPEALDEWLRASLDSDGVEILSEASPDYYRQTVVTLMTLRSPVFVTDASGEVSELAFNWAWDGVATAPPKDEWPGDPARGASNVLSFARFSTEELIGFTQWNGTDFEQFGNPLRSGRYRTEEGVHLFALIPGIPSAAWANASNAVVIDINQLDVQVSDRRTPTEVIDLRDAQLQADVEANWAAFRDATNAAVEEESVDPPADPDPVEEESVDPPADPDPVEDENVDPPADPPADDQGDDQGDDTRTDPPADDEVTSRNAAEAESEPIDPPVATSNDEGSGGGWIWVTVPIVVAGVAVGWRLVKRRTGRPAVRKTAAKKTPATKAAATKAAATNAAAHPWPADDVRRYVIRLVLNEPVKYAADDLLVSIALGVHSQEGQLQRVVMRRVKLHRDGSAEYVSDMLYDQTPDAARPGYARHSLPLGDDEAVAIDGIEGVLSVAVETWDPVAHDVERTAEGRLESAYLAAVLAAALDDGLLPDEYGFIRPTHRHWVEAWSTDSFVGFGRSTHDHMWKHQMALDQMPALLDEPGKSVVSVFDHMDSKTLEQHELDIATGFEWRREYDPGGARPEDAVPLMSTLPEEGDDEVIQL